MHDYFFLCPEATRKGIFREDHKMEKEINKMAHRYKENGRLEAVFQVSSFSGSRRFSLKDQVLMGETGVILDTDDSEKIREL